jgi:MinD-like ATPase involved in chromosome partitioning or flagellar assembly
LLDAADQVLVVGAADPIGVQRLIRGLAELRDAGIGTPVSVVVNKVRRGVVPGDPGREVGDALQRFAGYSPAALLPYDRDGIDAALAAGRLLGEMRPSSPLRKAVAALAAALLAGEPGAADREPLATRAASTARHRRPS